MKKFTLDILPEIDFDLYGIVTSLKGYSLAAAINSRFDIQLCRVDDLEIKQKKSEFTDYYSIYTCKHPEVEAELFLIGNKSQSLLISHLKPIDFFWMVKGEYQAENEYLMKQFNSIPGIQMFMKIDPNPISSFSNLIF